MEDKINKIVVVISQEKWKRNDSCDSKGKRISNELSSLVRHVCVSSSLLEILSLESSSLVFIILSDADFGLESCMLLLLSRFLAEEYKEECVVACLSWQHKKHTDKWWRLKWEKEKETNLFWCLSISSSHSHHHLFFLVPSLEKKTHRSLNHPLMHQRILGWKIEEKNLKIKEKSVSHESWDSFS
jgi:hypothetical protein